MPLTIEDAAYSPNTGNRWTNLQPPFTVECFYKFLSTEDIGVQIDSPLFSIFTPGMTHFKIMCGLYFSVTPIGVNVVARGVFSNGDGLSLSHYIGANAYSGKWAQVAVRIDTAVASTVSLIINGVEVASGPTTKALLATTATSAVVASVGCDVITIGSLQTCGVTSKATIDDVFIYNSYMSVEDLKEHWDMTGQPNWHT